MRGGAGFAGAVLAGVCGVLTAYSTLQPALKEEAEKRDGTFTEHHQGQEKDERVISQAILSDLREAKEEVARRDNGRFAWGIRKWFAERGNASSPPAPEPSPAQSTDQQNFKR